MKSMWRTLSIDEEKAARAWARKNWKPTDSINPTWHPVIVEECQKMMCESLDALREELEKGGAL